MKDRLILTYGQEERKTGSPVRATLKQLGGDIMPIDKACKEIYEGIFANEFTIIIGTQLRILTKLSRILPDTYRGQIDKNYFRFSNKTVNFEITDI